MVRMAHECFPALDRRCNVCGLLVCEENNASPEHRSRLCETCRPRLAQRTSGFCPRCAKIFDTASEPPTLCLDCRLSPPPWQTAYFYAPYDDLLKSLILQFKFQSQLGLGRLLHALLRSSLESRNAPSHDLIVPVPLHPRKLRQRGFNQSLELARGISGDSYGPLSLQALSRTRNTPAQHTLPRVQRMQNLKEAFQASRPIVHAKSVLLIDDILTTGATAHAATRALLRAGAAEVHVLVVARA